MAVLADFGVVCERFWDEVLIAVFRDYATEAALRVLWVWAAGSSHMQVSLPNVRGGWAVCLSVPSHTRISLLATRCTGGGDGELQRELCVSGHRQGPPHG